MSTVFANRDLRASALRAEIEASLAGRFAGALTPAPRERVETLLTGIEAVDAMLGNGVPIGAITELAGPLSSGRTTLAMSTVASAMREGNMCAWVDASDALDPESAAANGVCLERLLWVRCGVQQAGVNAVASSRAGVSEESSAGRRGETPSNAGRAGQHPRDEVRGLDLAVGELLRDRQGNGEGRRDRSIGTPGAPNRSLVGEGQGQAARDFANGPGSRGTVFSPVRRSEQISSDRQPSRRAGQGGDFHAVKADRKLQPIAAQPGLSRLADSAPRLNQAANRAARSTQGFADRRSRPWARLDQALRAADLLLQAGGFRVLVLDLGSIAPADALRIPLATWFRFRAAADQGRTVLLLLTQASCAKSSAGLVLQLDGLEPEDASLPVLEGVRYQASALRQRFSAPRSSVIAMDRFKDVDAHAWPRPEARWRPQATWQLSAYPLRAEGSSA